MAIFDIKKKKEEPQQTKTDIPVQQVIAMKQKGLSNNQIIQGLQRDGYKSHQIFDAINQAELRSGNLESKPWPSSGKPIEQPDAREPPIVPETPEFSIPEPVEPMPRQTEAMPEKGREADLFEEIAEAIVDEKWEEMMQHVNKIVEWKERTDSRIERMETEFRALKQSFDKLQTGVLGKVSEYDQHIRNVGAEIKGMEQVFQKIIPELTGNVDQLSRITQEMRGKKLKRED